MESLFSYGTLQQREVQIATFGRELIGIADALVGYVQTEVEITDESVIQLSGKRIHPMLKRTNNPLDCVLGMVFEISSAELAQADAYEVSLYKRVLVTMQSGKMAWIYTGTNK